MKNDLIKILIDELDEEFLVRMPEWFRILREVYRKRHGTKFSF
jgi:hypothetical protein